MLVGKPWPTESYWRIDDYRHNSLRFAWISRGDVRFVGYGGMMDIEYVIYSVKYGDWKTFSNKEQAQAFVDQSHDLQPGNYLMVTILEWGIIKQEFKEK